MAVFLEKPWSKERGKYLNTPNISLQSSNI